MPIGYTASFAERLDRVLPFHVVEASDGLVIGPKTVAIARAGKHLLASANEAGIVLSLAEEPAFELHRPSVDVLFASAARAFGETVVGVVMTGMGSDGLAGARAIRARGGRVLAETEESAVVYGMPRVVIEAGLANNTASLEMMAKALRAMVLAS